MRKVLVTGGYGFLGRNVALKFKSAGWHVTGIGHGRWDKVEYSQYGFDAWLDAEISLSGLLSLDAAPDVVAHCAGNGSVGYSLSNPYQDFSKTVVSTLEVLEYMRLGNPGALLIYPSSAGVYGAKEDAPISEDAVLNPISPYGVHKKTAEEICLSYSSSYGLRIAIVRYFSLYGPGLTKQLLWDAAVKFSNSNEEALFWGTGEETRDWLNVQDAAELCLSLAAASNRVTVVNGACGDRVTVAETLHILRDAMGLPVKIKFNGKIREGDPRFYHADVSRVRALGWRPAVPLKAGIRQYIRWFTSFCQSKGELNV